MAENISREYSDGPPTVTIEDGNALSTDVLDMRNWAGGIVEVDGWTPAALGFHVCDTEDGTFKPLVDENGAFVEILVFNATYMRPLPAALFAAHFVKAWSQAAGVGVNQVGADRVLTFQLKG